MPFDAPTRPAGQRFRELASLLPDFVVTVDRQRRYKWVNRVAPGLTEAQVLSSRVDDFVTPEDLPRVVEAIERCFETGQQTDYRVTAYGDGKAEYHFDSRAVPFESDSGERLVLITTTDRTKEVKAELRFRRLLEASPDYILAIDGDARVIYVNRTRPGLDRDSVIGSHVLDFVPEESTAEARAAVTASLEQRVSSGWESESQQPGAERFDVRVLPIEGPDDARALVVVQDISEQFRVARALQMSEDRLARVMGSRRIGLYELNLATGHGDVSPAFAGRIGFDTETTMDAWRERLHPDDQSATSRLLGDLMEGRSESIELDYRMRTKAGEYRWFQDQMTRVSPTLVAGLITDVTEVRELEDQQRQLQRQLEHTQRLESIGQLAGGVAHDFNNLLTVIMGSTQLAGMKLEADHDASPDLQQISKAASRGAQLTQQLLAFSRRSTLDVASIDLAEAVNEVVDMTRRIIPETISIANVLPSSPILVSADRQQLEQALLNLCINARDAMLEGGQLTLTTSRDSDEAIIRVSDTGEGIESDQLERVFEPFFTTKAVGKGSGLGLAMVHGIVEQHRGSISVSSQRGKGTEFEIRLPVTNTPPARKEYRDEALSVGGGRILVAEDEPAVLAILEHILRDAGYEVVCAKDGLEAVEMFESDEKTFDLLLFDLVMPRLTGWQAYERIRSSSPTIRALFCSGYAATAFPEHLEERPAIVSKPYEPASLLRAIAEALSVLTERPD